MAAFGGGDTSVADDTHALCVPEDSLYATAHVAAAAAMWLVRHDEKLDKQYKKPWQRIEAFRSLLKTTSSGIKGGYPTKKGTGILDIHALLKAKLPKATALKSRQPLS